MIAIFEVLVTSSVLIIGILALRKLTMGYISMRLRYALWLLVAVRLLMPVSVGTSPVSVMNLLPASLRESYQTGARTSVFENEQTANDAGEADGQGNTAKEEGTYAGRMEASGAETVFPLQHAVQETDEQGQKITIVINEAQKIQSGSVAAGIKGEPADRKGSSPVYVLLAVWGLGALIVGGYMLFMRARFVRYLRENRNEIAGEEIPVTIERRLADRGMRVYRVKGLPSPCLVGRHIYIGEQASEPEQGLTHILAHEYCHAVHGDGFWALLRCFLVAVYWFDPFVWAAAFAARQDSDLACDEAVVGVLGEKERFAYGRTLLALLRESGGRAECPGMPPMFSGGERSVRERIVALAERNKAEAVVLVAVLSMVCLICGCAFTGAQTDEAGTTVSEEAGGEEQASVGIQEGADGQDSGVQEGQTPPGESDGRLSPEQIAELEERALQEAQQAAFEEVLNYHGVMEGRDDSELFLNRQVDMQLFYEYGAATREMKDMVIQDAPEEGWYLLCCNEEESISLYGLFTKDFGCRGMKTLIGEDVNTFDLVWYPSGMNGYSGNIRVLEQAQDGLPRRFVFKYMEEESSETEIWRLASGFRYDTGTVDLKVLPEKDYLSWADWHMTYQIDEEREQVRVFCDEDGMAGILDISDYAGLPIEEVCVSPDTVAFDLDSEAFEGEENIALHLCVGLKLAGYEDVFIYRLSPLAVQVLCNEDGGFRFRQPTVDEKYQIKNPVQERKLEEIKNGSGEDALAQPLENAEGHHDVALTFVNPCPDRERISDSYGERTNPITGEKRMHNGVDMAAPMGTDILAAADGTVYRTGFDATEGNYVVLWHEESGQMTYYTHCKDILVSEGDRVSARDKIATVGQTGRATGPHLHFAVSYEGEWQEPVWGGRK